MTNYIEAKAYLTPTQRGVYAMLRAYPDGVCRRDFAEVDVWEVSNRIGEIETRLGITIQRDRCKKHNHRRPVTLYRV